MALIECTECSREISDKARFCPHCGLPMNEEISHVNVKSVRKKKKPIIVNCLECGKKIPSNVTACPYCDCLAKWAIPEEYQEEPIFYLPTSRVAPPESEHRPTCNHKNGIGFGIGGGVLLGDIDV